MLHPKTKAKQKFCCPNLHTFSLYLLVEKETLQTFPLLGCIILYLGLWPLDHNVGSGSEIHDVYEGLNVLTQKQPRTSLLNVSKDI